MTLAAEQDTETWFQESQKLAGDVAYADPVKSGAEPYVLDRTYETLAAARLANLITTALK